MKALYAIGLLILSNLFMTLAWYGHLQFKHLPSFKNMTLIGVIFMSWGLAFFEYIFQVPANRVGYRENGGPFSLFELKFRKPFRSWSSPLSPCTASKLKSWPGTIW